MKLLRIVLFAVAVVALPQSDVYPTAEPEESPGDALDVFCAAATSSNCHPTTEPVTTAPSTTTPPTTTPEPVPEPTTETTPDPPAETPEDPNVVEIEGCPSGYITCETSTASPFKADCQIIVDAKHDSIDCGHNVESGCSSQNDISEGSCKVDVCQEKPSDGTVGQKVCLDIPMCGAEYIAALFDRCAGVATDGKERVGGYVDAGALRYQFVAR